MELVEIDRVDEGHEDAVRALLAACDEEFVPPLSARHSTRQANLDGSEFHDGVDAYFDEMRRQPIILAVAGSELLGFLSYIPGYELPFLDGPSSYVSTVCVAPAHRRRGVASALYGLLEERVAPGTVSLRTWSTNVAQITALERRGYACVRRIADDRGAGIDTVYFAKRLG